MTMKRRQPYKGFVIEVVTYNLRDSTHTAHFNIEKHDGTGIFGTPLQTGKRCATEDGAVEEAIRMAMHKIDTGFEVKAVS